MAELDFNNVVISVEATLRRVDEMDESIVDPPKESADEAELVGYVKQLFTDSKKWRETSFRERLIYNDNEYKNPTDFFRDCRKLEAGMHWQVWGRRNDEPGNEWKQELVDNEIGNQIRLRKSYLAANWHDVAITPNLVNISDIVDQERHDTDWGDMTLSAIARMLAEGTAVTKTVLDRDDRPEGLAREILLDNAGCFPTPYSTDFNKRDGCWYFIHASPENLQWARDRFPKLDMSGLVSVSNEWVKDVSSEENGDSPETFRHTKPVLVMECWLDDPTLEKIDDQGDLIDEEHARIARGEDVEALESDNDRQHLEAHAAMVRKLQAEIDPIVNPEASQLNAMVAEYLTIHIVEHMRQLEVKVDAGIPVGKQKKYPFGRRITVVGDKVAEDVANPYNIPWRKLFRKIVNEKVNGFWWGRGVPEILWESNYTLDTMLSRTADTALTVGMPKRYFSIEDKDKIGDNGLDNNDPLQPAFVTRPPSFAQGMAPRENMQIYEYVKADAKNQLGVNDVSYGKAPGATVSGKMVETLLQQNSVIVTGEAQQRFTSAVEHMIEARLELYKQFYTEPRIWMIGGQPHVINLSEALSVMNVYDPVTQETKQMQVPYFQVLVRPNSNTPQQFEMTIALLFQLAQVQFADGSQLVTRELLADVLSERYPQFGRDSKYWQESEIMKLGMQKAQEIQAQQMEQQKAEQMVQGSLMRKGVNELTGGGA